MRLSPAQMWAALRSPVVVYASVTLVLLLSGCASDSPTGNNSNVSPVSPTANFSSSVTSGPAPLTVQFNDASIPGSASISSWSWSFGDGATGSERNPSHVYANAGFFDVSLTVATSVGSNTKSSAQHIRAYDQIIIDTRPEGPDSPRYPDSCHL
jgi:PKD repeat protein